MKRYETLERQLCSSRSAALVPPPFRPAVGSHAPAARRMTAIPVSRLRPPNVSILFGVAAGACGLTAGGGSRGNQAAEKSTAVARAFGIVRNLGASERLLR